MKGSQIEIKLQQLSQDDNMDICVPIDENDIDYSIFKKVAVPQVRKLHYLNVDYTYNNILKNGNECG